MATGFALLKNLGLGDAPPQPVSTALKIRPRGAGVSETIDAALPSSPLLKPVGAWRRDGPPLPPPPASKPLPTQSAFCESSTLPSFQSSLCAFHCHLTSHSSNAEASGLAKRASALRERLDFLSARRSQFVGSSESRDRVLALLGRTARQAFPFPELFSAVAELGRNPELLTGIDADRPEYGRAMKSPFDPVPLSLEIRDSAVRASVWVIGFSVFSWRARIIGLAFAPSPTDMGF